MIDSFEDAKTVKECIETATVDAYGEYEQATGWLTCLEEVFLDVKEVKIFSEVVNLSGFDLDDTNIVAICSKGDDEIRVTLDSLKLIKPSRAQKLWLKAWKSWRS